MMRRALLTALLLPIVTLGLAPVAEQQRVLRRRAIFAGAASAVLAPAAALALPGVFECFEEVDGYVVNVCKKDRLERERSAPPRPRPEEREVDMALVNGALERARMKKANCMIFIDFMVCSSRSFLQHRHMAQQKQKQKQPT